MLQDLEPQGSAVLRLCCVHELGCTCAFVQLVMLCNLARQVTAPASVTASLFAIRAAIAL
jgi:hypothetical protein